MIISFIKKFKYQLLLVILILLALYPLSFFIYIPKWDNINGYLPYRYFISDYLWNGKLPLWNPFQRLGYPGYADLQSGVWNPLVWIIMLFGKYTINSLIIELLLCYVFAGLGFFKLSYYLFKCKKTSFILGLSYALSGFMVGSSQLMVFLIAVTWFPWIIYSLLNFFNTYKLKYKLLSAVFIALFITGASPAYTIILAYIVIGMFSYQILIKKDYRELFIGGVLILVVLTVLILPYINSFIEFAPYFNRTDKLEYSKFLLANPFTPVSYISFAFPYSVISNSDVFNVTDLSLRNGYFGLVGLIGFCFSFLSKWNRTKYILLISLFLSLLLAAGGETFLFKYLYHLPGFGIFRHPSMFRAFSIFCCLLLAGNEIKLIIHNGLEKKHKIVGVIFLALTIIVGVLSMTKSGIAEFKTLLADVANFVEFSQHSMSTHLLLNTVIILVLFIVILVLQKITSLSLFKLIIVFVVFDLLIQTRLTIPTTVCYKIPQSDISEFFKNLPNEINQEYNNTPLGQLDESQVEHKVDGIWQNLSTYNKTLSSIGVNPMRFKSFDEAKEDGRLDEAKFHNIIYPSDSKKIEIKNIIVGYNEFSVEVENRTGENQNVILNQNYHHLWSAKFNGKPMEVNLHNKLTMEVEIPKSNKGVLVFEYKSPRTLPTFIISFLGYVVVLVLLFKRKNLVINSRNTR